jgi:hypothetical protein
MLDRSESVRLQLRVLHRLFLLRVIDIEAFSAQADVIKLLGQFAALLAMISIIQGGIALFVNVDRMPDVMRVAACWTMEHRLIATTMLAVGLFAVLSWDATFPDRRDVMVLAPLPVHARTLFLAKIAASVRVLCLCILALNVMSGITWPLVFAHGGLAGIVRSFAAYWWTIFASGAFLFCSVLTVQGFAAKLLSRRYFLRLSAFLQLAAFCLFLGVYFLQPGLVTPVAISNPENQRVFAWLPSYWFLALFNQLNSSMHPGFTLLARRAWIGLSLSLSGAVSALLLCYFRTMRKIVEEPDTMPKANGWHWSPSLGRALQTALLVFSFRSLVRSRQHRIVVAFYLGVGFAVALSCLNIPAAQQDLARPSLHPASLRFLISTIVMMSFAVVGIRVAFSLPVSLPANWILRITQVHPSRDYIATTRRSLLVLAVAPVLIASAAFSLPFQPWLQAAGHLAVLGLLGIFFTELSLLRFHKIPFTCSFLPGKANVQFAFWAYLLVLVPLTEKSARFEQSALEDPLKYIGALSAVGIAALALWVWNTLQADSAVLTFEELPPAEIMGLGLGRD